MLVILRVVFEESRRVKGFRYAALCIDYLVLCALCEYPGKAPVLQVLLKRTSRSVFAGFQLRLQGLNLLQLCERLLDYLRRVR